MSDEITIGLSAAFAQFRHAESRLDDELEDAGFEQGKHYARMWYDDYDNSIEFGKVDDDFRMNEAQQRIVHAHGFSKAFVNHKDGWETHYSWDWRSTEFKLSRGWRRRYVKDPAVTTTREIGANSDDERGYFEISYWPDGWNGPSTKDWLESGYMRIVPDPLQPPV